MARSVERFLKRTLSALLLGTTLLTAPLAAPVLAETVLRIVPQADLKLLDPVFTTANVTSNHGYMVYDTPFALDSKYEPQPEMVDTWTVSADQKLWTFKLRDGLKFSDGSPVEGKDVAASLKRWMKRIVAGQTLANFVDEVTAPDAKTFEIKLKQPFGPMLLTLAGPENPMFVMREKEAMTDPNTSIREVIGSGPFVFEKEKWQPGNKVFYAKSPTYVPRNEPPSGFAGGKVAKVDRVEWIYIPDGATSIAALGTGEVDIIEIPPTDLLPTLKGNKDVVIKVLDRIGTMGIMRPNSLIPPFNNPKARQALLYIVGDQKDYLASIVGSPEYQVPCWSIFVCGTPLATKAGIGDWAKGDQKANMAKAKQLFEEAGYKGEPVVVLSPSDAHIANAQAQVTAEKLRQIGINVDLQTMDWGTMLGRRGIKDTPDKNRGAWNIFFTWSGGLSSNSPLSNVGLSTVCNGTNWFGWPCDEELEKMRLEFFTTTDPAAQKLLIDRLQTRFFEVVPFINPAQFVSPVAYRNSLSGVLETARLVLWNIEKK